MVRCGLVYLFLDHLDVAIDYSLPLLGVKACGNFHAFAHGLNSCHSISLSSLVAKSVSKGDRHHIARLN